MRIACCYPAGALLAAGIVVAASAGLLAAARPAPAAKPAGTSGGIPATLIPSDKNPLVAIRILFHAGSVHEPRGKEGLAALTAALLGEGGTKKLTYAQLLDALFPMAARIDVRADKEVTVVSGTVHRDNLEKYYGLLRQVLLDPRFDPADFERLKADQLNDLVTRLRATDDENLGKETLGSVLYSGHPYGRPASGTVQGLKAVTLDDVKVFYKRHFTRESCEIGIAGGYPAAFVDEVSKDLARLPEGRRKSPDLPGVRVPQGIEVTLVTKPSRASAISIGFPIRVTRADDDFYALAVANSYLGEHRTFNGVLMNKMRAERGLNYGDYSYVEHFVQHGGSTFQLASTPRRQQYFSIWIRPVAIDRTHFAIREALLELDRLVRNGMTEADFQTTREFLLNYSRLWTQTASRRLGYEMDGKFYGKASLVDELQKRLPAMTVAQVNAAIRKHLQADNAYVAVVTDEGQAKRIAEALEANAPSPITYATPTQPEVLEEDRKIAVFPLKVNADRLRIVPAAEMFEK